jgi:glucose-1-phosphate adenylyltransferase
MGADYYEADLGVYGGGPPHVGIGHNCNIRDAIIDKNVRIGDNVVISPEGKDKEMTGQGFYIRDGIVVIPRIALLPRTPGSKTKLIAGIWEQSRAIAC